MALYPAGNLLQRTLGVSVVVADQSAGNDCLLPGVLALHFRNRNVKFTVQSCQQRFDAASFFFEGSASREVDM
jgi:hypothetical protein